MARQPRDPGVRTLWEIAACAGLTLAGLRLLGLPGGLVCQLTASDVPAGQAAAIEIVAATLKRYPEYLQWYAIDRLNPNANLVISDGKTILNLDAMRTD